MTEEQIEKEKESYGADLCAYCRECEGENPCQHKIDAMHGYKDGFKDGYNKANEWHYVKDEGTPIHEGHYLVCLRNKDHDILDCWISFDKDIGWYSLQVRLVDIYAWKEIVPPKESE